MTIVDELIALLGYKIDGEDDLKRFNKSLDSLEKKAYNVGKAIGRTATIAGAAMATGFTLLGNSVLQTAAKFESYAATLETIEGSADGAQKALYWIKDFAQSTPYEVDELTAAFVKLRSYGLDPMDGTMTVLGDTASGMGKSIDQVVEALADATTFQFERLKELGIVSSQAGDKVTFSWIENGKAMSKSVKKSSDEVTKFLTDVWGRKFGGAMIRQSKTWNGMMSNLGDTWTAFQLRIAQSGFFDEMKNRLADVMDTLQAWADDGTLDKVAKTISGGFSAVADVVGKVIGRIAANVKYLNENWEALSPWIKTIGFALAGLIVVAFPIASLFAAFALAVDDLLAYMQGGESVIGDFIQWIKDLIPGTSEAEDAIAKLGVAVSAGLLAAFIIAPATMTGIVARLVASFVAAAAPALIAGITGLASSIGTGFAGAFALLSNPIGWAVILAGVAAALIAYFWTDLQALWAQIDFASLGRKIGDGIIAGLKGVAGEIAALVQGMLPDFQAYGLGGSVNSGSPTSSALPPGTDNRKVNALGIPITADQTSNAQGNVAKINGARGGTPVVQDNSTKTQTTTVNAPVTVHVQQPTQAPAAVGAEVSRAIRGGAAPARQQGGNAF